MFDCCLTWFCIQLEATVSNTSTLVRLREFAAEKCESFRNLKLIPILVDLVLQMIVEQKIS